MKENTTIIDISEAYDHLDDENWAFIDCRFNLSEPRQGFEDYKKSHIQGAVYADLNKDLSGPVTRGKTGRHPLPDKEMLIETFSRFGIDDQVQVVAYDESSGYMAAARLWWLLKWAGHEAVVVLNKGFRGWMKSGFPISSGVDHRQPRRFNANFNHKMVVDAGQVMAVLHDPNFLILDSRSSDRYRGENETIDPVAGHIPGAITAPFTDNLNPDGSFKTPGELNTRFAKLIIDKDANHNIFYCGSGVTAAHNVLAFVHAGNNLPILYPGSWSDWITDPDRPIAKGEAAG